jgi:hypothetical protein
MTLLFLTLFRNAYTAIGVAADRLFEAGHIDIVIEMGLQLTMRAFIKLDKPRYFARGLGDGSTKLSGVWIEKDR